LLTSICHYFSTVDINRDSHYPWKRVTANVFDCGCSHQGSQHMHGSGWGMVLVSMRSHKSAGLYCCWRGLVPCRHVDPEGWSRPPGCCTSAGEVSLLVSHIEQGRITLRVGASVLAVNDGLHDCRTETRHSWECLYHS
jgi:hypothetical protein